MLVLFLMPFLIAMLTEFLPLPGGIRYLCDGAWMGLLVLLAIQRWTYGKEYRWMFLWVMAFLIYTLMVYAINYQSVWYYIWGLRNNFRFYVAFFAFAAFLKRDQIEQCYKLLDSLFWINLAVSMVQYYFLGYDGDYLGGLFGVQQGCNGYSAIFFSIVIIKSVVMYLQKQEDTWLCLVKCAAALYIAALAELKFFFVVFVAITLMAMLFTEFTWRKVLIIVGGSVGLALGTALLAQLFVGGKEWFSLEWLINIALSDRGYTSSGDLNRLTAIPMINELWLTDWNEQLFGLGLGNCDGSTISLFNTPFYEQNGTMHYTWISYAQMYLETGYFGLVFYAGFFLLAYLFCARIEKHGDEMLVTCCRVARIMAVCCVMISVYNSSLRMESAYMAYFVLAVPFAAKGKPGVKVCEGIK